MTATTENHDQTVRAARNRWANQPTSRRAALRLRFAEVCLDGVLVTNRRETPPEEVARRVFAIADAMLAEMDAREEKETASASNEWFPVEKILPGGCRVVEFYRAGHPFTCPGCGEKVTEADRLSHGWDHNGRKVCGLGKAPVYDPAALERTISSMPPGMVDWVNQIGEWMEMTGTTRLANLARRSSLPLEIR